MQNCNSSSYVNEHGLYTICVDECDHPHINELWNDIALCRCTLCDGWRFGFFADAICRGRCFKSSKISGAIIIKNAKNIGQCTYCHRFFIKTSVRALDVCTNATCQREWATDEEEIETGDYNCAVCGGICGSHPGLIIGPDIALSRLASWSLCGGQRRCCSGRCMNMLRAMCTNERPMYIKL